MTAKCDAMQSRWPTLPPEWDLTYPTLHMWTQVVGKVALALMPKTNHFWNVTLRVTPRGLTTMAMPIGDRTFSIAFDFIGQQLRIACSDGGERTFRLEAMTVADFYRRTMAALADLGISVHIWTKPSEVADPIPFEQDTVHKDYDPAAALAFWHVLERITPVFETFRARFIGKSSPVHFFWGSFDLAVTRFSGKAAPERPGADSITREAYSHEVISHGYWPGGGPITEASFYAYGAPKPVGFENAKVGPEGAYYQSALGEFLVPYRAVAESADPEAALMRFMDDTYAAAAELAHWDRAELERA